MSTVSCRDLLRPHKLYLTSSLLKLLSIMITTVNLIVSLYFAIDVNRKFGCFIITNIVKKVGSTIKKQH